MAEVFSIDVFLRCGCGRARCREGNSNPHGPSTIREARWGRSAIWLRWSTDATRSGHGACRGGGKWTHPAGLAWRVAAICLGILTAIEMAGMGTGCCHPAGANSAHSAFRTCSTKGTSSLHSPVPADQRHPLPHFLETPHLSHSLADLILGLECLRWNGDRSGTCHLHYPRLLS